MCDAELLKIYQWFYTYKKQAILILFSNKYFCESKNFIRKIFHSRLWNFFLPFLFLVGRTYLRYSVYNKQQKQLNEYFKAHRIFIRALYRTEYFPIVGYAPINMYASHFSMEFEKFIWIQKVLLFLEKRKWKMKIYSHSSVVSPKQRLKIHK